MDQEVDPGSIVFLKILIHLQTVHHTAGQHAIRLPALIVLKTRRPGEVNTISPSL